MSAWRQSQLHGLHIDSVACAVIMTQHKGPSLSTVLEQGGSDLNIDVELVNKAAIGPEAGAAAKSMAHVPSDQGFLRAMLCGQALALTSHDQHTSWEDK